LVKINIDADISRGERNYYVGMVLRDENGHFLKAKIVILKRIPSAKEVEAWALLQAIQWISQMDF